jgi:small subunit ribosomal protein S10
MTFVTKLRFTSGNRHVLDTVADDIKQTAQQKGVELKGPHSKPPENLRVPQPKRLNDGTEAFTPWTYTIYTRTIHIVGHDDFARATAGRDFPDNIHVAVDVDRTTGASRT